MRTHSRGGPDGRRPGMTLVELMVSMMLLSFVMGTILTVVMRQQRFYRSASEIMETRGQLRSAISILPVELRGVSTQVRNAAGTVVDSDIRNMGPNLIEIRSTFGAGIVCDIDAATGTITLYPDVLASSGLRLGSFLYEPAVGDIVYFLNNGEGGSADDSWEQHVIDAAPTVNAKCATGLAAGSAADLALPRREISLATAPSADIVPGAPVRISRTVEYALYQNAADGLWYLGQRTRDEGTNAYTQRQPVAGPYLPATNDPATSGFYLRYYDDNGAEILGTALADRQNVSRIDVIVRGQTATEVNGSGFGSGNKAVLQTISIAIRNRT